MKRILLGSAAFCLLAASAQIAGAQTASVRADDPPKPSGSSSAAYISTEDLQKALDLGGPTTTDHTIRTVDVGQNIQMDVAMIQREATGAPRPRPAAGAPPVAARVRTGPCGLPALPAGAKEGPPGNYLTHDEISEVYVITKGTATMVTGGTLYAGTRGVADNTGPGCSGKVFGDVHVQNVKPGDIVVVPQGVPHGFSSIAAGGLEYLNFRPDPKHFLPPDAVYPGLEKH